MGRRRRHEDGEVLSSDSQWHVVAGHLSAQAFDLALDDWCCDAAGHGPIKHRWARYSGDEHRFVDRRGRGAFPVTVAETARAVSSRDATRQAQVQVRDRVLDALPGCVILKEPEGAAQVLAQYRGLSMRAWLFSGPPPIMWIQPIRVDYDPAVWALVAAAMGDAAVTRG